jgi:hemolysin D
MKSAEAAAESEKVVPLRQPQRRGRAEDTEFLPAALEVVETPASPAGRAVAICIIAVFCLALVWSAIGRIDIVASARGKIIPTGHSKTIQPLETGVVHSIRVKDGQVVKAGDVLIELDPTITEAEVNHARSDLVAAQLDVARLRAILENPDDALAAFHPPPGAPPSLLATQKQFLLQQVSEYRAKIAGLDREYEQKQAERDAIAANISKIKASIPILQQLVDMRKTLLEQQWTSKLQYLDATLKVLEQENEIPVQEARLQEATAALGAISRNRERVAAEFKRTVLSDLAEAERKAAGLTQDVIKGERRARLQVLTAPIDGVVQQLAVHTVGGVVTPAEPLLVLVPENEPLKIEAMVENRDSGFVTPGQSAEIKVDAFNFTRYGLLHGTVQSVSHDAIVQKKAGEAADKRLGAANDSSEPNGQELVYSTVVSLDRTEMDIDGITRTLSPGMAVTVEIKTGTRTILSYLLSPLGKVANEALSGR